MVEELDITIHQQSGPGQAQPPSELLHTLALASIGALALARDETEKTLAQMRQRSEQAQRDSERLLGDLSQRLRPQQPFQQNKLSGESGFEQVLRLLNLPSKRDIDDLSAKLAQLTAQMEELRRSRDAV